MRLAQTCPAPCRRTLNQSVFVAVSNGFLFIVCTFARQRNEPNPPCEALPTPRQPEISVGARKNETPSPDGRLKLL